MNDSIKYKLLFRILILVVFVTTLLTAVSFKMAVSIIEEQMNNEMIAQLNYQETRINEIMTAIETRAEDLAGNISLQYANVKQNDIEQNIINIAQSDDMILGSGVWFEPYIYNPSENILVHML